MDIYAQFGPQLHCRPKPVRHQVRVHRHNGRRVIGTCTCGRRFDPEVRHYLRTRVLRHTTDIVDEAPGEW